MGETQASNEGQHPRLAVAFREPWKIDVDQWAEILQQERIGFHGLLYNAAELLIEISQGMHIVDEKLKGRGLKEYKVPRLGIIYGSDRNKVSAYYDQQNNAVLLGMDFLEDLTILPLDEVLPLKRTDGEVIFKGTVRHLARLLGVEESHHGAYFQYKNKSASFVDALSMPVDEYHALDEEFRALLMKRRVAEEQAFPTETIDFLKESIHRASQIRLSKANLMK